MIHHWYKLFAGEANITSRGRFSFLNIVVLIFFLGNYLRPENVTGMRSWFGSSGWSLSSYCTKGQVIYARRLCSVHEQIPKVSGSSKVGTLGRRDRMCGLGQSDSIQSNEPKCNGHASTCKAACSDSTGGPISGRHATACCTVQCPWHSPSMRRNGIHGC
jgi:hypothetical protein